MAVLRYFDVISPRSNVLSATAENFHKVPWFSLRFLHWNRWYRCKICFFCTTCHTLCGILDNLFLKTWDYVFEIGFLTLYLLIFSGNSGQFWDYNTSVLALTWSWCGFWHHKPFCPPGVTEKQIWNLTSLFPHLTNKQRGWSQGVWTHSALLTMACPPPKPRIHFSWWIHLLYLTVLFSVFCLLLLWSHHTHWCPLLYQVWALWTVPYMERLAPLGGGSSVLFVFCFPSISSEINS